MWLTLTSPSSRTPYSFQPVDAPTTSGVTEGFGLLFYNARWYDLGVGRFAQADMLVPDQGK